MSMTRSVEFRCWTQVRQTAAVTTAVVPPNITDYLFQSGRQDYVESWAGEVRVRGSGLQSVWVVSLFEPEPLDQLLWSLEKTTR